MAHEEHAAFVRLEQPLVWIDRDRVRALDSGEQRAARVADHRRTAIGGIDVEPHGLLVAQVGERRQRVDGACVRGAGGATARGRSASSSTWVRAVASAFKVATDPPLTKAPSAPAGSPKSSRSQSSVTSSIVAGPEPPVQEPTKTLRPAASASAKTPTGLLGPGIRAKKRG